MSTRLKVKMLAVLGTVLLFQLLGFVPKYDGKIDPKLKPYVTAVKNLSKGNLVPIAGMGFGHTEENELAFCFTGTDEITVNEKAWKRLNYQRRVTLIAHEIAHCSCGQKHIDDIGLDACYKSFMSPSDTGARCTKKMFDQYVKEMQEMDCGN